MNRFSSGSVQAGSFRLCGERPAQAEVQASEALKDILWADVEDGDDGSNRARWRAKMHAETDFFEVFIDLVRFVI